jgi:toxin-antitoxin system PIN domain toxin
VIAVDTNLLVYAHREDSSWHEASLAVLTGLAEGRRPWAIPWPCIHEFLAVVTHPRIFAPPTPTAVALDAIAGWLEAPTLQLLAESHAYWDDLRGAVETGKIAGPKIHDARIAALCAHHGVAELWTADRDFGRFPALATRNPLVG